MKRGIWSSIMLLMIIVMLQACSGGTAGSNDDGQSLSSLLEKHDREFGTTSLQAASLYFQLGDHADEEDKSRVTEIIEDNLQFIQDENDKAFADLASHIRNGENEKAKLIYVELVNKYIPDDQRSDFQLVGSNGIASARDTQTSEPASVTVQTPKLEQAQSNTQSNNGFVNAIAKLDPKIAKEKILEIAKKEWPNDQDMQQYEIENQTEAYNDLVKLNIDIPEKEATLNKAFDEWGYQFDMVLYKYGNQMNAYDQLMALRKEESVAGLLNYAFDEWGTDYEMVLYEFEKQADALLKIGEIIESGNYNEEKMEAAVSRWGKDYTMILYEYEN